MSHPRSLLPAALMCACISLACSPSGLLAHAAASQPGTATATAAHVRTSRNSEHRRCRSKSARSHRRKGRSACAARRTSHKRTHPSSPSPSAARRVRGAASQASSATLAALVAPPCTRTDITPTEANLPLARAAVLCLVNQLRAQHGESPLRPSARLEQAAEGHCAEMIAQDYFAHISPSGETPADRMRVTGYIPGPPFGYVIGENLAWGTYGLATPQAIVAAWVASPEHLANMLEARYTETGVGVAASVPASLSGGSPGATYGQEFGVILE